MGGEQGSPAVVLALGQGVCGNRCWGEWGPGQREERGGVGKEAAEAPPLTWIFQFFLQEDPFLTEWVGSWGSKAGLERIWN